MKKLIFSKLNFRQRYALILFTIIVVTTLIILAIIQILITRAITNYSYRYWLDYTESFANSAAFSTFLDSKARSNLITENIRLAPDVLNATIINKQNELLASVGDGTGCDTQGYDYFKSFTIAAKTHYCFYAPIFQKTDITNETGLEIIDVNTISDNYIGHVEIVFSKKSIQTLLRNVLTATIVLVSVLSIGIYGFILKYSNTFTLTLFELVKVAKNRIKGNRGLKVRFSDINDTDLELLQKTMNTLLETVDNTEQELEQKIENRTRALQISLDKLTASAQYQRELMAIITHEMKTPLTGLKNYIYLANEKVTSLNLDSSDNELTYFLNQGRVCTDEMEKQIMQWLNYAKLEADKIVLHGTMVDIKQLVQICIQHVKVISLRNHNQIFFEGPSEQFYSDETVLSHVLTNLIHNACKFTHDGIIEVKWQLNSSQLKLTVSDTGIGIPELYFEQIFEPFWQVDMKGNRKYQGSGLGLTIVKLFLETLSGTIHVAPNAKQGTIFTIQVPILKV